MTSRYSEIIAEAVANSPAPKAGADLDPQTRRHFERIANRRGMTLEDVISGIASTEDVSAAAEIDEIAAAARRSGR
jgi:hypothetical protein